MMTTNFPSGLDSFTNPTATDAMDSATVPHADQHADVNDAVEALQAKVGVDGSAVTSSLDYQVANQGLHLITATSVVNGTINGGTVTNTGTADVRIDGIFSSQFVNYRIIGRVTNGSSAFDVYYRWRTSSGNVTSNDYWWSFLGWNYNGGGLNSNASFNTYGFTGCTGSASTDSVSGFVMDIYNPYASGVRSFLTSQSQVNTSTVMGYRTGSSGHRNNQSHTGITFTSRFGHTFDGEFRVYGYNQ